MICSPTLYWILYLQHLNYNLHCFIYIVLLHFPSEKRLYLSHVARSQLLGREQLCCISHYCTAWTCRRCLLSICRYIRFCYQCPIQLVCVCPVIQWYLIKKGYMCFHRAFYWQIRARLKMPLKFVAVKALLFSDRYICLCVTIIIK